MSRQSALPAVAHAPAVLLRSTLHGLELEHAGSLAPFGSRLRPQFETPGDSSLQTLLSSGTQITPWQSCSLRETAAVPVKGKRARNRSKSVEPLPAQYPEGSTSLVKRMPLSVGMIVKQPLVHATDPDAVVRVQVACTSAVSLGVAVQVATAHGIWMRP